MLLLKLKKKPEKKKMLQRFFKVKRKKKWRHWRSFKFFFLFRKSLSFFSKLKWLFNQKRILWHYFSSLYGKKFKSLIYKKAFRKIAFGKFFFFIITFLELRLGVLLIRMRFSSKLIESNNLIANGFILVNGKKPSLGVLIVPSCVVQKKLCNQQLTGRRKKKKWQLWKWRKWKKKRFSSKQKNTSYFWLTKRVLSMNYLEIHYKVLSGIVIRNPVFGEILLTSQKKFLSSTMLKKIYFLY